MFVFSVDKERAGDGGDVEAFAGYSQDTKRMGYSDSDTQHSTPRLGVDQTVREKISSAP